MSVSPACTMSAIRDSVAEPSASACELIRSSRSGGRVEQAVGAGLGHGVEHDQVAQPVEQVGGEPARVVTGLDDPVDRAEDGGGVVGGQRVDDLVEQGGVGDAQQADGARVGDALGPGAGQQLVEDRQGVADRSAAGPRPPAGRPSARP